MTNVNINGLFFKGITELHRKIKQNILNRFAIAFTSYLIFTIHRKIKNKTF